MNESRQKIDARGLSCPQPAMLVNHVIRHLNKGLIEVLADSGTARDNITRSGKNSGWTVTVEEQPDNSYRIILKK